MKSLSTQTLLPVVNLLIFICVFSCGKTKDPGTEAPDSFDGFKWGTPYDEAYKYCEIQKDGKVNPNGGTQQLTGYDDKYKRIWIRNYNFEGLSGDMNYFFSYDSTELNNKSFKFIEANFRIATPYLSENNINIKNEYKKFEIALNRLDSILTIRYGKGEEDKFDDGDKKWLWPGNCELKVHPPTGYESYERPFAGSLIIRTLDRVD